MRARKKQVVLGIGGFLLIFMVAAFSQTEASDCYQLFYNWDCIEDLNFDKTDIVLEWKTTLVSKHKDGSIKLEGNYLGAWALYGDSFAIDSWTKFYVNNSGDLADCNPLFSGYKTYYGFMVCRNGVNADKPPGCWLMVKLKPKDCPWINEK